MWSSLCVCRESTFDGKSMNVWSFYGDYGIYIFFLVFMRLNHETSTQTNTDGYYFPESEVTK